MLCYVKMAVPSVECYLIDFLTYSFDSPTSSANICTKMFVKGFLAFRCIPKENCRLINFGLSKDPFSIQLTKAGLIMCGIRFTVI